MRSHLIPSLTVALLACTTPSDPSSMIEPEAAQDLAAAKSDAAISEWADAMPLVRGEGHPIDIMEVWLDPQASAAITLDGSGEVRLWPALAPASATADLDALAPVRVPLHEAVALSFARTSADSFLIAAIDTAQIGRVVEIRVDEAGRAELIERFTIPPSDPIFELHVLDDGERLLALGVDHRLRLYDRTGKLLDELNEHGFAPWQLRIVGRGESRKLAVVLAGPTRVQSLTLEGNELAVVGEARRVRNDRGPNLNDLQLTVDGRYVTSFRRPKSKSHEWTLELLELATGEVRVLRGECGGTIRPRLHLIDEQRALLEDGTGVGYWIDLGGGVVQPVGFELPEDLDDLPAEARVTAKPIPLAYSIERERWHSTVVEGMRVVPNGRSIVVDPIESDAHHRLGHALPPMTRVGFSADGSTIAWGGDSWRSFESIIERGELQPLAEGDTGYAWSVDETIDAVDGQGRVYSGERGLDATLVIRDSHAKESTLAFDDLRLDLVLPSPDGRWLAIVDRERGPMLEDWDRGPDELTLSMYTIGELPESPVKQWSMSLDGENDYAVVWSPASDKLAVTEVGVGGMVLTPAGELLFERRHGNLVHATANDAEVATPQAEALRERQRIERERARFDRELD
jgi:hypothetical protein